MSIVAHTTSFTVPKSSFSNQIVCVVCRPQDTDRDRDVQVCMSDGNKALAFGILPNTSVVQKELAGIDYLCNKERCTEAWEKLADLLISHDPQYTRTVTRGAHGTLTYLTLTHSDHVSGGTKTYDFFVKWN